MYRCCLLVIHPRANYSLPISKSKDELCQKPNKLELEVKDQRRIEIMFLRDTSSHGDRLMCEYYYTYIT